ncbi:MAG: hypothetical protein M3P53_04695 [Actinomycetota bacterium]|nr:hypothetical protein [Actinomycetota bacterium]
MAELSEIDQTQELPLDHDPAELSSGTLARWCERWPPGWYGSNVPPSTSASSS